MNAFLTHHQDSIRCSYSCFDRLLLNAIVHVLQYPARVVGFLNDKRQATARTPAYCRSLSTPYHRFVQTLATDHPIEVVEPPTEVRREDWGEPFFQRLHGPPGLGVILKSRANARVA